MNYKKLTAFPVILFMLVGCSTVPEKPNNGDENNQEKATLDTYNENMYSFNNAVQEYVFSPIGTAIDFVLPDIVEESVMSMLDNLSVPNTAINNALQGKFTEAGQDLGRFGINSTIGILGIIDWASMMGIPKHEEDLGQTLAVYGVASGPYVVLPIMGGATPRGMAGFVGSFNPVNMTNDEIKSIVDNMNFVGMLTKNDHKSMSLEAQKKMFEAFRACNIYDGDESVKASCDLVCNKMTTRMQTDLDKVDDISEQQKMIEMAGHFLPSYCSADFKTH